MPTWYPLPLYHPYYYPYAAYPSSGISLSWSAGSFGLSLFSYSPVYRTRYYDSWHCGGRGYSSIYYDGWRSGWYGGISYIYNPLPVYRTVYLYEPAPTVIQTETVYVNQPSTVTYATAQPAAATSQTFVQTNTEVPTTAWATAPSEERIEALPADYFSDGYSSETAFYDLPEDFALDLRLNYVSYAESLDPETIWLSYSGLDYWDTDTGLYNNAATATYGY
ncbi:MAG: hypothetical protein PHU80_01140 [Kiritimatiellae bacterium]|nr:hypothetical protein [Kiritimatiellia bacterium]